MLKNIVLILLVSSFVYSQDSTKSVKQSHPVYFYLDCGCFCSPDSSMDYDHYWFIADSIYTGEFDSLEVIVDRFRNDLENKYSQFGQISNVVINYQDIKAKAVKDRLEKTEKMKGRGYKIIMLPVNE